MSVDGKISGNIFLSLDKDSLEHYGLSPEFQTLLIKIIEEVVCSPDCLLIVFEIHYIL
jgi:hypothetical protein